MTLSNFIQRCLNVPFCGDMYMVIPLQHRTQIRIIYEDKPIYEGTTGRLIANNLDTIKDYFGKSIASWSVPTEDVEIDKSKVLDERWMPVPSILEVNIIDSDIKESSELMSPLCNMRRAMNLSGISNPRIVLLDMIKLVSDPSASYITILNDRRIAKFHGTVSELIRLMDQDNKVGFSIYSIVHSMYVSAIYIPIMRNDDLFDPNKKYYPDLTMIVDTF